MRCAFIFPGQGSQALGMGKDFLTQFSLAKELFEQASDVLGFNMQKLLFEEEERLNQTQWTQPAIFLVSYIAHSIFQSERLLLPSLGMGHSLGEISAVAIANGLNFENAIKLTHLRGKMMAQACEGKDAGMMVVVGLDDAVMEEYCEQKRKENKEIWCANYNGDGQIVLAGKKTDFNEGEIKGLGAKRALLLPMSVASHCPMLEGMCEEFENLLDLILVSDLSNPILSNATIEQYSSKDRAKKLLIKQLVSPVLYKQGIQAVANEVDYFIEFGNGNVLKGLNKRLSTKPTLSVSNVETLKETLLILEGEKA